MNSMEIRDRAMNAIGAAVGADLNAHYETALPNYETATFVVNGRVFCLAVRELFTINDQFEAPDYDPDYYPDPE